MAKSNEDRGLPGLRSATRIAGVNGGRVFGEGNGGADHAHRVSERDRESGNPTPAAGPSPDCIADVMAQGSPRPGYTSGGRPERFYMPGPGINATSRDGTPAEKGIGPEPDRAEVPDMPGMMNSDSWDPMDRVPEKPSRSTGTKPPM